MQLLEKNCSVHPVMWCDMHAKGRQRAIKLLKKKCVVKGTILRTAPERNKTVHGNRTPPPPPDGTVDTEQLWAKMPPPCSVPRKLKTSFSR